ncbi:MAG: alpha/beta fold hydrolase [Gammaproteobacteria bacterium]|nr:alpha/beta fold hydrolase [Gammaproteobacteria bacterium]
MPVDLHFERHGDGPPLLILHGLFGSSRNWQGIATRLADEFDVITVDLRNHGQSSQHPDMSYGAMVEDLERLRITLGLDAVVVLGHSMGGKAAMQWAVQHPAALARLVVVDIAPVSYQRTYAALIDSLLSLPLMTLRRRADAEELLQVRIPERPLRLFLLQNLRFEDGQARWRINLPFIRAALPHIMGAPHLPEDARYPWPTQFVLGQDSDTVQPAHHAVIHHHFPAARFDTIANAGHWPHADQPAAFLATVRGFLAD